MASLGRLEDLREFIKRRVTYYEFTKEINAWVFVWLPKGGRFGHSSIFIGGMDNGSYYASWRPHVTGRVFMPYKYPAAIAEGYETDYGIEKSKPDIIYGLKSLNTPEMKGAWRAICTKKENPSFHIISKNGSTIVKRVLKSGLIKTHVCSKVSHAMGDDFHMATPILIVRACNVLRNSQMAVRINMSEK